MKNVFSVFFWVFLLIFNSCQKKLVEEPHDLTPLYLQSEPGVRQALNAAYGGLRTIWGAQEYFQLVVAGTDMWQRGNDGNAARNEYDSKFDPSDGYVEKVWQNCYTYINTCNAVIDFAENMGGIDENSVGEIIAEAKFLRANYYFILVQLYGEVTIIEHFENSPTTSASRNSLEECYNLIIQDLNYSTQKLPQGPMSEGALPGEANKAAARHLLAKVYLTRAYLFDDNKDDFLEAGNIAVELIKDANSIGIELLNDFGNIYQEGNEANPEVLWSVQYTQDLAYNDPGNNLCYLYVPQYEKSPGMERSTLYGRPYIRESPTRWLTDTVFMDKGNDTRYDKTFQTVWICNTSKGIPTWPDPLPQGAPVDAIPGQPKFGVGDTAIYMPGIDVSDEKIKASPYLLIPPRNYTISLAPAMKKYFDTKRPDMNAKSNRPVIVYRLGETYLIAAEALYQSGDIDKATKYINAIRKRAAYPDGDPIAMEINNTDLSLDFILDERARELCGEMQRWPDLVRTKQLLRRVRLHNIPARPNIQEKHILRPIPQEQIDAVTTGPKYEQNPGY